MSEKNTELIKAVRQALYNIGRGNPIPGENALLGSPLVIRQLQETAAPDTPENRQAAVIELLRSEINEYGLEQPEGRRHQEVQRHIFDVLHSILSGRTEGSGRSYERYHAQGVRILVERLHQELERLGRKPGGDSPELQVARQRAQEITQMLCVNSSTLDLFAVIELNEVTRIIQNHNYYSEARQYLEQIITQLNKGPTNLIVLKQLAIATENIAHCFMNQNEIHNSIHYFHALTELAKQLRDGRKFIDGTHMLGVTYNLAHNWNSSLLYFDKALLESQKAPNHSFRAAWIQRDKISAFLEKGDFTEIPMLARSSLAIRERLGDGQGYMLTLQVWGRGLIAEGKFTEAEQKLREALSMLDTTSSKLFHTMVFLEFAQLYKEWSNFDKSNVYADKARKLILQYELWHQLKKLNRITNGKDNEKER